MSLLIIAVTIVSTIMLMGEIMQNPAKFASTDSGLAIFAHLIGFVLIWAVFGIGTILPMLAQSVRRFRDAGIHWGIFVGLQVIGIIADILMFSGKTGIAYVLSGIAGIAVFVITLLPTKNPPIDDPII